MTVSVQGPPSRPSGPVIGSARILVVDDDPGMLQTITWILKEHGYDVASAQGGAGMWEQLELRLPDLLLLDVIMPDADGFQLLEQLKSDDRWRELPVLMVSSLPPEEATVKTLGLGAADFVRKPFRVRELLARIQAQLRIRAMLKSAREALRTTEEELLRAREEAEVRRKLVDILHEVTSDLSSDEIFHILARRVARALNISHCSVILARPGDRIGVVATAYENPALRNLEIQLDKYPEIRAALDHGRPVLIGDLRTSPLYADIREKWKVEGIAVSIRSVIALPFTLDRMQAGVFFLRRTGDEPPLTQEDVEFADAVIKAAVSSIQRAQVIETTKAENTRLEALAHTDALTQVLNRRALTMRLSAELDRARRYDSVVTLLMIDLDHFKRINDTYGHLVGDDLLREVAAVFQHAVRSVDVVARYGGEEFVVVLPETSEPGGVAFAERLRERIEAQQFGSADRAQLHLTISVGVATFPSMRVESVEDLFARADAALYRAKAEGRNRVRT
ncbi:MAG TPA: diguanylate cyclase [Gemmatimonadaceae bacterium]|nr:diguanylate cyclase [Gemmatimonadaceae bacterium]